MSKVKCWWNAYGDQMFGYVIAHTLNADAYIAHTIYHPWLKIFNGPKIIADGQEDILIRGSWDFHFMKDWIVKIPTIIPLEKKDARTIIVPKCSIPEKEYNFLQIASSLDNPLILTEYYQDSYAKYEQIVGAKPFELASYLASSKIVISGSTALAVLSCLLNAQVLLIGEKWSTIDTFSQFTNVKCLYPMCDISRELLLDECQIATRKG